MGLRFKFNLVLLVVFLLGLGITGSVSYELLHRNARDEVLRNAGVMMEAALAIRAYTVGQVRPNLRAVPSYTSIRRGLRRIGSGITTSRRARQSSRTTSS